MELFRNPIVVKSQVRESITRKVGVVSASVGAGASFVCGQLALGNYAKVNVIEMGNPYFYLALDLEKRMDDKAVFFYEDELSNGAQLEKKNEFTGINWLVRKSGNGPMGLENMQKISLFPPDGVSFFDFSGCERASIIQTLTLMDEIYVVIDPLPSKLIEAAPFIEEIKLRFPRATYIVNKMNRGVYKNELKRFLGNGPAREMPYYPPEKIYRAEYNCMLPVLK